MSLPLPPVITSSPVPPVIVSAPPSPRIAETFTGSCPRNRRCRRRSPGERPRRLDLLDAGEAAGAGEGEAAARGVDQDPVAVRRRRPSCRSIASLLLMRIVSSPAPPLTVSTPAAAVEGVVARCCRSVCRCPRGPAHSLRLVTVANPERSIVLAPVVPVSERPPPSRISIPVIRLVPLRTRSAVPTIRSVSVRHRRPSCRPEPRCHVTRTTSSPFPPLTVSMPIAAVDERRRRRCRSGCRCRRGHAHRRGWSRV